MATTFVDYTGDGNATKSFSFPSIKEADIKVEVDEVIKTSGNHYNITSYTTTGGGNVVFTSGNIPSSPAQIRIFRDTDVDSAKATFTAGSSVKAGDLNNNNKQLLYSAQEEQNQTIITSKIKDAAVTTAKIKADNITSALIADDQINSEHYVDGSIDTAHIADAQITTAKIAADAVNGTKIADDSINSEHYVDGSIDTAHIADSQVTTAKIANLAVESAKIGNGSVLTAKIADGAITTAKLGADVINSDKIADNAIGVEHLESDSVGTGELIDSAVTTAKIANSNVTTAKIADSNVTTAKIADSNVTTAKIAADAVTSAKIADDAVGSEHIQTNSVGTSEIASGGILTANIADGQVITSKLANTNVTDAKLASNAVTTSKITDANVTTVKIADSNVTLAKLASDLKQTTISDSDTQLPTSGAVVDYVAAQIAPIGGLEVIATEVAFPNTQPQAGVVISIADAGGIVVNGSGTSTTGRTVGGSTVTINNINSQFNNTTVDAGVSFMVSSTGSGQVYNYHKATLKEADLLSLSGDINDFAERYRVSADPDNLPNKDEGDLVYDTNANKMKVYDNSTSAWKEVTSTGDFKYLFLCPAGGTGAPTINGSIATYDLRESSNSGSAAAVTSAAQLIVSINGVVQKANTGTSAPAEGFALVDANTIVFGANLQTGDSVFIVQIGSAISVPVPGDGTVSTAKLASSAVTTVKIADDAVTGAKIATNLDLPDNNTIRFGDSQDLVIEHDSNHSYITHSGQGDLFVQTDGLFTVQKAATTERLINANADGNVELFYDGSKKLETDSSGVKLSNGRFYSAGTFAFIESSDTSTTTLTLKKSASGADSIDYLQCRDSNNNIKLSISGSGDIDIEDDAKLKIGTSDDLQLYHNGSHSRILDSGTGKLQIGSDTEVEILNGSFNESIAKFIPDGAVELYHDNVKKLETASHGVTVTGQCFVSHSGSTPAFSCSDNGKSAWGSGNDLTIYHDGSNSYIDDTGTGDLNISGSIVRLQASNRDTFARGVEDGAFEIYYDNVKKFETDASGINVTGDIDVTNKVALIDNAKLICGVGDDLQIYHDGSNNHSYIQESGSGNLVIGGDMVNLMNAATTESYIRCTGNAQVELYYDNSKKFETDANGATITGRLLLGDSSGANDNRIRLGADGDLSIYHDGSHSYVQDNGTGELRLSSTNGNGVRITKSDSETIANFTVDGNCELYHDNVLKLETKSNGVEMHGYVSTEATSGSVAQFYHNSSADTIGIIMRHGRGGLSGFNGKMISFRGNDNTEEGSITIHTTSTAYNTSSDYRLKENEVTISDGIARLKTLKPYKFNFKKEPDVKVDGFFAHEVSSIVPEAITGTKDQVDADNNPVYQGIDQSKLVPLLTAALQEAVTKIETLETKVAALEAA